MNEEKSIYIMHNDLLNDILEMVLPFPEDN